MKTVRSLILALCAAGAGCATTPDPIRDADTGPPLTDVLADPAHFVGVSVRWGGTIAQVENESDHTLVYLVARDLFDSGRPRSNDGSAGRFIAVLPGFHDPAVLAKGRQLTAVGVLGEPVVSAIGEYDYRYPVVNADTHRLWPEREVHRHRHEPFYPYHYHDPWHPHDHLFGHGHLHR